MKLFNVTFEYTEQAAIGNIVAETADLAVKAAEYIAGKGNIKDPHSYAATEVTDFEKNENITVQ